MAEMTNMLDIAGGVVIGGLVLGCLYIGLMWTFLPTETSGDEGGRLIGIIMVFIAAGFSVWLVLIRTGIISALLSLYGL